MSNLLKSLYSFISSAEYEKINKIKKKGDFSFFIKRMYFYFVFSSSSHI